MLYPHLDAEQALMSITIEVEVEVDCFNTRGLAVFIRTRKS